MGRLMNELSEMFDAYTKEKGFGPRVLYIPNIGFATYHINQDECYIEDIYIIPEKRRDHIGTKLADKIVLIAKENNCRILTGTVAPHSNGSDTSRKALLSYGFKLFEKSDDLEKYSKEI
jgi:ribosomal protein S18 acetylase RimI-like enzyme